MQMEVTWMLTGADQGVMQGVLWPQVDALCMCDWAIRVTPTSVSECACARSRLVRWCANHTPCLTCCMSTEEDMACVSSVNARSTCEAKAQHKYVYIADLSRQTQQHLNCLSHPGASQTAYKPAPPASNDLASDHILGCSCTANDHHESVWRA